MITGANGGGAVIWDVSDRTRPHVLARIEDVRKAAINPAGTVLATGTASGSEVILWEISDPARPEKNATLSAHTAGVIDIAFSPHGHTLATGNEDTTVQLWDYTQLNQPIGASTLSDHTRQVNEVAFGPDGHLLITAGTDDAYIWDSSETVAIATKPIETAARE